MPIRVCDLIERCGTQRLTFWRPVEGYGTT